MASSSKALLLNVSYSLVSNLVSTLLGILAVLILPKYLPTEQYGYYQLYLLYVGLTTLLALGIPEGIYLVLGGKEDHAITKQFVRKEFIHLSVFITLIYVSICAVALLNESNIDRRAVALWVCGSGIINCSRNYLLFILQAKGKIREYALSVIIERVVSLVPIITMVFAGISSMSGLLAFDTLGRGLSFIYVAFIYHKIEHSLCSNEGGAQCELNLRDLLFPGIQLMFASYASTIIVSMTRYGVEATWSISIFAQISLVISIANMFTRLINAVAIPVFPALKEFSDDRNKQLYSLASSAITSLFVIMLILIQPLISVLSWWLPSYASTLSYAALLIPMCLFESKTAIMVMSYAKSYREERLLLKINVVSIALGAASTMLFSSIVQNLELLLVSLVVVFAFRCFAGEYALWKGYGFHADYWRWDVFSAIAAMVAWHYGGVIAPIILVGTALLFSFVNRARLLQLIKQLSSFRKQ